LDGKVEGAVRRTSIMPSLLRHSWHGRSPASHSWQQRHEDWRRAAALAIAVGIACFLATWLGRALRVQAGVAIFSPASGIAVGALIALGPRIRLPIAVAVAIAAVASSLAIGRSPWLAIALGFINAGQAVLIAWLIERWFGDFKLDDVPRVLGFLAASAIGAAVGATGAALAKGLVEPIEFLHVWRLWFAARFLGTLTVAPILIGLGEALRERPPGRELIEGASGFVILGGLGVYIIALPQAPWESALPVALMVPVLLWITVRCRPVFTAAAVSFLALTILWATAFNIGHFGDASISAGERTVAGQTHVLAGAVLSLVLAALFAERRSREALLERSNERLRAQEETFRRLLGSLPAAIYTTDKAGRITYCNEAAVDLWGRSPNLGEDRWSDLWRLHHPDGTSVPLDERPTQIVLNEGRAVRGREALLERPDGTLVPIMPCPAPLIDEQGTIIGVVNMQLDLTEQKRAGAALAERDTLLTLASKVARVGSYALDCTTGVVRLTPGCAALYGLPEGTTQLSQADCRACVHPEDLAGLDAQFAQAFRERRREHVAQFRIVRPSDGEVRWIETRCLVSYEAGQPSRIVGIDIDLTERKRVEAEIKESESRLADALAAGQVIAFEWDAATRRSRRSSNAAAILGCQEGDGTRGLQNESFFERMHCDDRECFKARIRDLGPDRPSYALSFRFRSPDGRQLWLEETAKGEFDAAGRLLRIKGLTRNITDRKEAELALADRNLQLSLAGKAALVGSFSLDFETEEIQASAGYAAVHGLPEGTSRTTHTKWRAGVHPEDRARVDELRDRAFREQRREYGNEYRIVRAGGDIRWIESRCLIMYRSDGRPERMVGVHIDVTARKRAEEHQRMLIAELDHRVKNVLATVSAVASRTQDSGAPPAEFVATLAGRIQSMAATHELLSGRQWKGISVCELVRRELAPYMAKSNTHLSGPDVTLSPEAAQTVSMVLHELTTNAAKHGALSTDDGLVSVRWRRAWNADASLCIEWQEAGGPAVHAPEKSSYGTEVIRNLIPYELGGTVDLEFAAEGVRCVVKIPATELSQGNQGGNLRAVDLRHHERELSHG
jgi:PAS domain S-box-containing protein